VHDAGYEAVDLDETIDGDARELEQDKLRRVVILSALCTAPLIAIAMGPMLWPALGGAMKALLPATAWHWLELLLATPVQFYMGRRFYRQGWAEIRHLNPGMSTLVMMGSSAAYFYSVLAILAPGLFPAGTANLYFEASATIITLILAGKYLEARAKGRTSAAIRKLMELQPETAAVERDGEFIEVPIAEVVGGDCIRVRPGERIPVDGLVLDGSSYVDVSMVTGEPIPVEVISGSEIVGGTINKNGTFTFRATRVGADTVLARIINMVEEAQAGKPPIQQLADRHPRCRDHVRGLVLDRAGTGTQLCVRCRGQRPRHRLSLRDGPGHADGHHGRYGQGCRDGHTVSSGHGPGNTGPCRYRGAGQDRHADPRRAGANRPARRGR
jgi:Cu+-exporting ATPase